MTEVAAKPDASGTAPEQQACHAIGTGFQQQNLVSLLTGGTWYIAQRFVTSEPDQECLTRGHSVERKSCPHKRHRTDFSRYVEFPVGGLLVCHVIGLFIH
jgi:hypothetical protein